MNIRTYNKLRAKIKAKGGKIPPKVKLSKYRSEAEAHFHRAILEGKGTYEPCKLEITKVNKRIYTPDFGYYHSSVRFGHQLVLIEVKGGYKLQSEDRARLAWEIAAESPVSDAVYVWARKSNLGYWCEAWYRGGERIVEALVTNREEFTKLIEEVIGG